MFRIVPANFTDVQSFLFIQRSLGQVLALNPPNVSRLAGRQKLADSSSLLFRMRLPQIIYYDKELDFSIKRGNLPEMGMQKRWQMSL
ncbi:MAG: hypothetical protein U0T77_07010 [Chitinophagales bacterium]